MSVQINGPGPERDVALGQKEHELESLWHFGSEVEVRSWKNIGGLGSLEAKGAELSMIVTRRTRVADGSPEL